MPDAAVEMKCGCGQEATVNLEGNPRLVSRLLREFWDAHSGHRPAERPVLGFDLTRTESTHAVSHERIIGEDEGYWSGLVAGPGLDDFGGDDDDED